MASGTGRFTGSSITTSYSKAYRYIDVNSAVFNESTGVTTLVVNLGTYVEYGNFNGTTMHAYGGWSDSFQVYGTGFYGYHDGNVLQVAWNGSLHFYEGCYYNTSGGARRDSLVEFDWVPTLPTYTISYNANGGSGAPSAQTKTWGTSSANTITLSSTLPTRPGYVFVEWNTSADGTGTAYAPSATYKANAAVTLYAVWLAAAEIDLTAYRCDSTGAADDMGAYVYASAEWSVDSELEAASIAFAAGAATETVALTGTSGSATVTAPLGAGATPDTPITVYATLTDTDGNETEASVTLTTAYTAPVITALSIERVDSIGDLADDGEYALVTCAWRVAAIGSQQEPTSLVLAAGRSGASVATETVTIFTATVADNLATGTSEVLMSAGAVFSPDYAYDFTATLSDAIGSATASAQLADGFFPFDVLAGGHGAAFGKPASTANLLDVGYDISSDGEVSATDGNSAVHNLTAKQDAPTVLYDDATGTIGTVTLSDSAANYSHMRIYYHSIAGVYSSVDVYDPDGKYVGLEVAEPSTSGTDTRKRVVEISGTSIATVGTRYSTEYIASGSYGYGNGNYIYISRVEAWNQ